MARAKRTQDRPFPWRCGSCDEKEVYRTRTPYKTTIKYEGRPYDVEIPELEVPKCRKCGEVVFDNHVGDQINAALRQQLGLLQPEQIRAGRTELNLSQKYFAALLGVAEESVSRWETGSQVQSRSTDRQIRLFFELPSVRQSLHLLLEGEVLGETVKRESGQPELSDALRVHVPDTFSRNYDVTTLMTTALHEWRSGLTEEIGRQGVLCSVDPGPERLVAYSSYCRAAAKFAITAPREDVKFVASFLTSAAHRPLIQTQRKWCLALLHADSPLADPMAQRLARFSSDLEQLPERDVVLLLENFNRFLEIWPNREIGRSR